ncbi:MAG: hypothetical protein TB2022_4000 [Candidatus Phytoplasma citri]|nr:hypothetical protein EPWB_v2c2420 ['Echinacea purpurea' witches'-broom phytoplasma]WEX20479.1 MAG: hypothetical protein TB2022_4000 [Candidatus Phytoplasma aurantifolia]WKV64096.1 MAG: hypothetical protein NCHU2022_c2430 [Candidatus Phytoplasma australasiaticum]
MICKLGLRITLFCLLGICDLFLELFGIIIAFTNYTLSRPDFKNYCNLLLFSLRNRS